MLLATPSQISQRFDRRAAIRKNRGSGHGFNSAVAHLACGAVIVAATTPTTIAAAIASAAIRDLE